MEKLFLCRKCDKPKAKHVDGTPMKGKKLCKALKARNDLPVQVVPCKCLGKCSKGPNAVLMPGKVRLHRVTFESLEKEFARLQEN